ncbi:MAG: CHAT domain-containing protein [Symploca sp. SIO3E6]|nr:CHAT domain-containing protein [Caldora sp. SIO3E6]
METLGLAGLAVRAGFRSTLATLWQVGDQSTVKLMEQLYNELNEPGVNKTAESQMFFGSIIAFVSFNTYIGTTPH